MPPHKLEAESPRHLIASNLRSEEIREHDEVLEKFRTASIENHEVQDAEFGEVDRRNLLRKMDWNLIPWFSLLYLLSFLDSEYIQRFV
jgi:succinate dehydrogenase flavin-adding protein (antitoxin of CptAB toxin-antitoxin module)